MPRRNKKHFWELYQSFLDQIVLSDTHKSAYEKAEAIYKKKYGHRCYKNYNSFNRSRHYHLALAG